ncbi:MAG: ACT domain-containing protein [Candidatus Micrarchaeota archaeon]
MGKSVAKKTEQILESSPYLLRALDGGYANISEVARKIAGEMGEKASLIAVRAAVKRFSEGRSSNSSANENRIKRLLKESKLELATGISVIVVNQAAYENLRIRPKNTLSVVKSKTGVTIVCPDDYLASLEAKLHRHDIFIKNRDLVSLSLITPEKIEDTPGVVAFITDKLAENGINLKEFLSSYRDTMMILEKKDSLKAYQLMERLIS